MEMCLPLLPYPSTTIFTFFLVDQVLTSLSLVGPIPAFMCHAPPFKKNSKGTLLSQTVGLTKSFSKCHFKGSLLAQTNLFLIGRPYKCKLCF